MAYFALFLDDGVALGVVAALRFWHVGFGSACTELTLAPGVVILD
jgi:hypothetical protein